MAQETTRSQLTPSEPEIRLPSALADLAHSFEISKERALSKDVGFFAIQMLETSFQFLPEVADTERYARIFNFSKFDLQPFSVKGREHRQGVSDSVLIN